MRVLVAGWVGSTNLGDELLFRVLSRRLSRLGAAVATVSRDPATTRSVHGVGATPDTDVFALAAVAEQADLVVFGGGGLLQDVTSPFNLPYHLARVWASRRARTPVVGVGLGVGPLTTRAGRQQVRTALRLGRPAQVPIAVRDEGSVALLGELGGRARLAADLAFGPELDDDVPTDVRDVIGVCLRPWSGGGRLPAAVNWRRGLDDDPFVTAMAATLDDTVGRTGLDVDLIALQRGRDDALHERVADRMRRGDRVRVVTPTLDELLPAVGSCRTVASMRLHGGIAAALAGRPTVLLSYDPKVGALASSLGAEVVDADGTAIDAAGLTERLVRAAERAGNTPDEEVAAAVGGLRRRERVNTALLEEALDRV